MGGIWSIYYSKVRVGFMKFLVISDLHGDVAMLDKLDFEFKTADVVLCCGDFAKDTEPSKPMLDALCKKHDVIFAVPGNHDAPSFSSELEAADVECEGELEWYEGLLFCGSGGSTKHTGWTPNEITEEEIVRDFDVALASAQSMGNDWSNLVAIMHNPPKDTKCDKISDGTHVGSVLLRQFIEKTQPLLVVTGHIHESAGVDKIGDTIIVNPGSLAEGRYAVLEVAKTDGKWNVVQYELCSLDASQDDTLENILSLETFDLFANQIEAAPIDTIKSVFNSALNAALSDKNPVLQNTKISENSVVLESSNKKAMLTEVAKDYLGDQLFAALGDKQAQIANVLSLSSAQMSVTVDNVFDFIDAYTPLEPKQIELNKSLKVYYGDNMGCFGYYKKAAMILAVEDSFDTLIASDEVVLLGSSATQIELM